MPHSNILDPKKTALVIVDFQEAFRQIIPDFDLVAKSITAVIQGFKILDLPIIVTEQYPRGLGKTAVEILSILPETTPIIEKTKFSSCGEMSFLEKLETLHVRQVLLCGLETHICVNQTAHDLLDKNFNVHILEDSVGSRTEYNKQIGLKKIRSSGAISSCVEMALFELMGDSKHTHFKKIQALIK